MNVMRIPHPANGLINCRKGLSTKFLVVDIHDQIAILVI